MKQYLICPEVPGLYLSALSLHSVDVVVIKVQTVESCNRWQWPGSVLPSSYYYCYYYYYYYYHHSLFAPRADTRSRSSAKFSLWMKSPFLSMWPLGKKKCSKRVSPFDLVMFSFFRASSSWADTLKPRLSSGGVRLRAIFWNAPLSHHNYFQRPQRLQAGFLRVFLLLVIR